MRLFWVKFRGIWTFSGKIRGNLGHKKNLRNLGLYKEKPRNLSCDISTVQLSENPPEIRGKIGLGSYQLRG